MPPEQLAFPFAVEDTRRMIPTDFIGAAVFSALNRNAPPVMLTTVKELGRMNGYRLTFKGRVLTQAHADVWLAIIELLRQRQIAPGIALEFRASELLRLLMKSSTAGNRHTLYEWITDMMTCAVAIFPPNRSRAWFGPLLFGELDEIEPGPSGEKLYKVLLHPMMQDAFQRGYTGVRWSDRKSLQKNELALWLHQYLIAYREPVAIGLLQQLSWQTKAKPEAFRFRVKKALAALEVLHVISGYKFDDKGRLHTRLHKSVAPAWEPKALPR